LKFFKGFKMASQRQGRIVLVVGALAIVGGIIGVGVYNTMREPDPAKSVGRPIGQHRQGKSFKARPFAPRLGARKGMGGGNHPLLELFEEDDVLDKVPDSRKDLDLTAMALAQGAAAAAKVETKRDPKGINVLLLVVDTERADYTEPYGYKHKTTPFLAELAKEGITFKNVFSPASWTAPAMFSIITGKYPSEHGVTDGLINTFGTRRTKGQQVLPDEALTLAEILKDDGYTTFGVNTNLHLNSQSGYAQGFEHFYGENFAWSSFPNLVTASIADNYNNAPKSFLWLHYFDPHFPFRPMSPWFSEWNDTPFRTTADFSTDLVERYIRKQLKLEPGQQLDANYAEKIYTYAKAVTSSQHVLSFAVGLFEPTLDHDYVRFIRTGYLSEIRHTDEEMKKAVSNLDIDDNTLVIYASDHGEEMFEHGQCGHRQSVYQELINVPLIIRLPGRKKAGTVIDTPVSLVDIVPTILDLIGVAKPPGLSGQSLAPLIEGKALEPRPLFTEVNNKQGETRAIIEYPWKYIHAVSKSGKRERELYNLVDDPLEQKNLASAEPERTTEMQKRLLGWIKTAKPNWDMSKTIPLGPQQLQQLKSLGYIE
jgi:arylsulfatase A-like enzyme